MPLDAIGAEGAFVSADARFARVRRQILVAIFAIRPKFERHVSSPKDAKALKRGPASRGTQTVAGGHVPRSPPAAKSRRSVRRIARRRRARRTDGQSWRTPASRRSDAERQPLEKQALAYLRLRIQGPAPRRLGPILHGALFPRRADRARRRASSMLRMPPGGREGLYRRFPRRSEPHGGDGRSAPSRTGRGPAQPGLAGAARQAAGRGDDRA